MTRIVLFAFALLVFNFNYAQDDFSKKALKASFLEGCKGSKLKGATDKDPAEICECAWEYFEENYDAEDFARIAVEAKSRKQVVQILLQEEGLLTHITGCLFLNGEESDNSGDDENAALKKAFARECVDGFGKKARKKASNVDIEGYCGCAAEKLFDDYSFEEIALMKSKAASKEMEKIFAECLILNMKL